MRFSVLAMRTPRSLWKSLLGLGVSLELRLRYPFGYVCSVTKRSDGSRYTRPLQPGLAGCIWWNSLLGQQWALCSIAQLSLTLDLPMSNLTFRYCSHDIYRERGVVRTNDSFHFSILQSRFLQSLHSCTIFFYSGSTLRRKMACCKK